MPPAPLLSVITPTHNPVFLPEILENLRRQTHATWEWVILPKPGITLPVLDDPRVRVIPMPALAPGENPSSIGLLKRICAMAAVGEAVVELDHDDYLSLDALELIGAAIAEGADFVFSDYAEFNHPERTPRTLFGADQGWVYYDVVDPDGHALKASVAPPAEVPWITFMSHAPNHVRAWRTSAYREVGGHDPSLEVGDDYDLVVRTYLTGKRFLKIPRCLYFYRVHPENTYRAKSQRIHEVVAATYNRDFPRMIARWGADKGLGLRHFGQGVAPPGFENSPLPGDNLAGGQLAGALGALAPSSLAGLSLGRSLCLATDRTAVFNKAWRALAPQGMLLIDCPVVAPAYPASRAEFPHFAGNPVLDFPGISALCVDANRRLAPGFRGAFMPLRLATHYPTEEQERAERPQLMAHLCTLKRGASHIIPWPEARVPD